eukprot:2012074-Amphidinium_carterae.2
MHLQRGRTLTTQIDEATQDTVQPPGFGAPPTICVDDEQGDAQGRTSKAWNLRTTKGTNASVENLALPHLQAETLSRQVTASP